MPFENIIYTKEEAIAKIVLNRPDSLNALFYGMGEEIGAAIVDARDDPAVRALVITGAGRAFSSGGDLRTMEGTAPLVMRGRIQGIDRLVITELMNLEKPAIAMVNGAAVGGGCNLALACDIVIAAEEARFSQIFVRLGLVPDMGGIFLLPRLVGLHKAKELIFTGEMVDAREAERIGLINKAVPAAELESTVMELARRLAAGPTRSIGLAKVLLHRALVVDLPGAIELEALGQDVLMQTDDYKEGVRAFLEKRKPEFKGV